MAVKIEEYDDQLGIITFIQYFSLNDGPGIRTTVFLKGCTLNCKWCHNPEGKARFPEVFPYQANCTGCGECVKVCPAGALSLEEPNRVRLDKSLCTVCLTCVDACQYGGMVSFGKFVSAGDVIKEVADDKPFYAQSGGGMTLSGGDPLMQPLFARSLLKLAKDEGINTVVDTAGYVKWENIEAVIDYTDLFLFDIKHMDPEHHKDWSGVTNELIQENARRISQRAKMRIRIPIIPNRNDSEENLKATAEFAKSLGPNVIGIDLLPYHPYAGAKYRLFGLDYPFPQGEGYDEDKVIEYMNIFESCVPEVTIGG